MTMDVFSVQLALLLALVIGNFAFGSLSALFLKIIESFCGGDHVAYRKNTVLVLLLYFGGGVFVSTCFLNLLPKTREEFEQQHLEADKREIIPHGSASALQIAESPHHGHAEGFPIPEFIVLCGFFATYILQESLLSVFNLPKKTNSVSDIRRRFCSCAKRHTECSRTFKDEKAEQTLFGLKRKKSSESADVLGAGEHATNRACDNVNAEQGELLKSSIIAQPVPNYGAVTNAAEPTIHDPGPVLTPPVLLAGEGGIVIPQRSVSPVLVHKFAINCLLIVIVLSFQAIFQGIAIGRHAEVSASWTILLVMCLQEFLVMFVAGTEVLANTDKTLHFLIYVGILSAMSSVGVCMTVFARNLVEELPHIVAGTINGIICGALLYITFCEILRRNRSEIVHGLQKFSATALGAGFMAILLYITVI